MMIKYRIEVYDTWGRRIASYDEVPLLEATRSAPDEPDTIRGLLPGRVTDLGHGYRIRIFVDDPSPYPLAPSPCFCEACVTQVRPQWSDTRKLILDRYVSFHEVIEFEAELPAVGCELSASFRNRTAGELARGMINRAPGSIHYGVAHGAYPDGAEREYAKFLARKMPANELEIGGIAHGQWVGADRINASGAYAKDGDTISGLVVDGAAWPDLRMMLIDSEEKSRNPHAVIRHPEVADWTNEQYAASGYKLRAEAAKQALQDLIDAKGIGYIELNPHLGTDGAYDDRVDMYGRYLGLVYGGGECFNAAQVELGHADVYLWEDGQYLAPELELKDFFSYAGRNEDSIEAAAVILAAFDVNGGVFQALTALAYAADGYIWSIDPQGAVCFRKVTRPDAVLIHDPLALWIGLGSDSRNVANVLYFEGNPEDPPIEKTYRRHSSIDEYGDRIARLNYFPISLEEDADKLADGLLNDVAYPEPCGFVQFYHGASGLRVGDILEFRDGPLRRLEREIAGEWDDRFTGKLVGRVRRITHRFSGREVTTTAWLTSPLRSVTDPVSFIVAGQTPAKNLTQFRLDDTEVGLDMGYHLD